MSDIRLGNAPCSWGTLEFAGAQGGRIDYTTVLDEVVASGFKGCELGDWGFMPTEPRILAEAYSSRGLSLTGAFVPVALRNADAHEAGLEQCNMEARLLQKTNELLDDGTEPFLVLADDNGSVADRTKNAGRIDPSMRLSDEEWQTFCAGANTIAKQVRDETGVRTVFHHHCAGFVETPWEIDRLLDGTDGEILGLVFDTGHFAFGAGGCDGVVDALNRYDSRIWYMHFKDFLPSAQSAMIESNWDYFQAVEHGIFCELGEGCVDFPAIVDWLRKRDYAGFITVEQDVLPGMGSPLESARRSYHYLTSIGL